MLIIEIKKKIDKETFLYYYNNDIKISDDIVDIKIFELENKIEELENKRKINWNLNDDETKKLKREYHRNYYKYRNGRNN